MDLIMSEDINIKKTVKKLVGYDKFSYINLLSLVNVNKQSKAKTRSIRINADLEQNLQFEANKNGRSLNAEIAARLALSLSIDSAFFVFGSNKFTD